MTGYQKDIGTLNKIAAQFKNSKYVTTTKLFGYNGQTENITDTSKITKNPQTWTSSTTDNSNEILGGVDVMYIAETDLVTNVLGTLVANNPSGTATYYWLASCCYNYYSSSNSIFFTRLISTSGVLSRSNLFACSNGFADYNNSRAVRPRLTLQSSITPASESGTSEEPYVLS